MEMRVGWLVMRVTIVLPLYFLSLALLAPRYAIFTQPLMVSVRPL